MRKKLLHVGVACLLGVLSSLTAQAVTDRFQAFSLWPQVGEKSFTYARSSQTLYQWQYDFELHNLFLYRPLELLDPTRTRIRSVVNTAVGHFLSAGVGFTDFWQASVTLPIFSEIHFEDPLANPSPGPGDFSKVGDLRIASKIRAIDANRHRFGLAFEPFVTVPLGADDVFMGESTVTGGVNAIGDVILSKRVRMALNIGAEFRGDRVTVGNINFRNRWLSSLAVAVDAGHGLTASGEVHANSTFDDFFSNQDTIPLELVAGLKWDIADSGFTLGVGGGTCAICGAGAGKARAFLSLGYRRMNDVILAKEKRDEEMRYVTLGLKKEEAIPYNIVDLLEKCPINPDNYREGRDDPACMKIYELQGLAKTCPAQEKYEKGKDNPKCEELYNIIYLDTDKDGVPNLLDWCPKDYGNTPDHGCPDNSYLIIDPEAGQIFTRQINFEFGKATLKPDAIPVLNAVAGALHAQQKIQKVSIEGHTDAVGSDEANLALSHARAQTVYRYLIDQGISPSRLVYKGFGEKYPRADNATDEGRAKNRRVEFIIDKVYWK